MDRRNFCAGFSVRMGTRRIRIELAEAAHFGGAIGLYRMRVDRRWLDVDDKITLLTPEQIVTQVLSLTLGKSDELKALPDLPRGSLVRAEIITKDGIVREKLRTLSTPIRGYDNKIYVFIGSYTAGAFFADLDNITILEQKR